MEPIHPLVDTSRSCRIAEGSKVTNSQNIRLADLPVELRHTIYDFLSPDTRWHLRAYIFHYRRYQRRRCELAVESRSDYRDFIKYFHICRHIRYDLLGRRKLLGQLLKLSLHGRKPLQRVLRARPIPSLLVQVTQEVHIITRDLGSSMLADLPMFHAIKICVIWLSPWRNYKLNWALALMHRQFPTLYTGGLGWELVAHAFIQCRLKLKQDFELYNIRFESDLNERGFTMECQVRLLEHDSPRFWIAADTDITIEQGSSRWQKARRLLEFICSLPWVPTLKDHVEKELQQMKN